MGIAMSMREYLDEHDVHYDVTEHDRTPTSARTAQVSHIPGRELAKGVVLKKNGDYMVAVLPANRLLDLVEAGSVVGESVRLASEDEAAALFPDCATGAIPVMAEPYRLACVVDDHLSNRPDIYFEGGDHGTLVHMAGEEFDRLMAQFPHGNLTL
ncbi:YbaK/EbsC family protein [Nocardia cyriacigeorgica]|uniref:YbaK/EbsC family protein n=4 Tax=Nocardia cyriacigeorgica TaxID=135487 RepID=A0A6P1CLY4_9NOCA|nr:YbaK/EbsC family protein [Nocardia cyriacigeorgica]MBF6080632.1 YbaK/EbsC family protein [Nocardia cyriacigeorgica]MBF6287382.1 YbaK/EbsC family protein [Nocardia cyriacigeorgica]MBF6423468.1 YbaK/EbsC family protein [Nocardia cyriacigeorgica]NEW32673.1 YbaK/EbsC family protein [Nocardia cyriacigeorgica]CCF64211.1 putative YbaK/prolyl-tRNA synthetase associated region [Nocardia cyriacigeorgica GUH-2]